MAESKESESFWIELYPYMFPDEIMGIADKQVEKILSLVEYKEGRVLDLCCGSGRHAIALARRGIDVTGVDQSTFLLHKARTSAAELDFDIEFTEANMNEYLRPRAFSLVINMFTSFGYFNTQEEDLLVLKDVYESLDSDGTLLIDILAKELIARRFQRTTSCCEKDGTIIINRYDVTRDWSRYRNEWILIKEGSIKNFVYEHVMYSGVELQAMLTNAGFSNIRLFGDLTGSAYGLDSDRLIAVAHKRND